MNGNVSETQLSAGFDDAAYRLLKALLHANYFGNYLPSSGELSTRTRLPREAVEAAMMRLENEDLISKQSDGYERIVLQDLERVGTIAFLLNSDIFADWYGIFQDYLIGLEEAMREEHYEVMFRSDFGTMENKAAAIREFAAAGVSGICFASFAEKPLRRYVREQGIPAVILGNASIHQQEIGCISNDNIGLMTEMVRFLVENGHRKIAYYTVQARLHDGFQDRLVGYELGMKKAGLAPVHAMVSQERHTTDSARQAVDAFSRLDPRPSAVICASDREACELMSEFALRGVNVPNEVSITGVDDSAFGRLFSPPLTSVSMYPQIMGRVAGHHLLNAIRGEQFPLRMLLPTEIKIRESVVALPDTPKLIESPVTKQTDRIHFEPEEDTILEQY
ncbi:MAG: LacI family DNA-binding transcriptional regulator [Verrucomicrobiota bacterium]